MRIQKFLSQQGIASRRTAEKYILEERVTVNGEIARIGQDVCSTDSVKFDDRVVKVSESTVVLAMNKPKGYISSNFDPNHDKTVFDLVPDVYKDKNLVCAGRLDKDSEGLLIITNDGNLVQKLTHPSHEIVKKYRVTVNRPFDQALIPVMLKGIHDEGDFLSVDKIIVNPFKNAQGKQLEIHLSHGKKREIRRILKHFGYFVKRLQRFQIGRLELKRIPIGIVKRLSNQEIKSLLS